MQSGFERVPAVKYCGVPIDPVTLAGIMSVLVTILTLQRLFDMPQLPGSATVAPLRPELVKARPDTFACSFGGAEALLDAPGRPETLRPIITQGGEDVRELFTRGLLEAFGFNQKLALLHFDAAVGLDPSCAMCHWGRAYALGPFINEVPTHPEATAPYPAYTRFRCEAGKQAVVQAQASMGQAGGDEAQWEVENKLVTAMAVRFSDCKMTAYDENEASFAALLVKDEGASADMLALSAEAEMNRIAWDYYEAGGSLRPGAKRARERIAAALAIDPMHPLALHLDIHVTEATPPSTEVIPGHPTAADGLAAADALRAARGWGVGHLAHMPAHAYLRTGRYVDAEEASAAVAQMDAAAAAACRPPYAPEHNLAVWAYAAGASGRRAAAVAAASRMRGLRDGMPLDTVAPGPEWATLPFALLRFGLWDDVRTLILDRPIPYTARGWVPNGGLAFVQVVWHLASVLSAAADKEQLESDSRMQRLMRDRLTHMQDAKFALPADPKTLPGAKGGLYSGHYRKHGDVLFHVAQAASHLRSGSTHDALAELEEALEAELQLPYMEPPYVFVPVRQCLGHVQLEYAQDPASAAATYRADLEAFPDNVWSLVGLRAALQALGTPDAAISAAADAALARADVPIRSSCPMFEPRSPA